MNILLAKWITGVVAVVMLSLITSPLSFASLYILVKPLVQPYATMHYELISGIPLTAIFPVLLIGVTIIHTSARQSYTFLPPNLPLLYFFLVLSLASFFNSVSLSDSLSAFLKILSAISLYLLIYNSVTTRAEAKKVLYAITCCSIVPMLFGYYQFFTETGHAWEGKMEHQIGTRIDSLLGEFNTYGIFLCMTIFSTLILLFLETSKVKKRLLVVLMASMLVSSILALNRGSWIALSFSILFSYSFYRKQFKFRWIAIAGVVIALIFSGMILDRVSELDKMEYGRSKNTFSGRVEYWSKIYPLVLDQPIVGHGLGTSSLVTEESLGVSIPPHNDYLRLPLEIGIPGAIVYLLFLWREFLARFKLIWRPHNWAVNFPMLAATIYVPIISITQNLVGSMVVFPMFFALLAISRKWDKLSSR